MQEYINALNHCIGYGNPTASFWFISLEEGGGYCKSNKHGEIELECIEKEIDRLNIYGQHFSKHNYSHFHLSNKDFEEFFLKYPDEREKANKDISYQNYGAIYNYFNTPKIALKNIGDHDINLFISNLFPISRGNVKSDYDKFVIDYIFDGNFVEWKKKYWIKRKKYISDFFHNSLSYLEEVILLLFGAQSNNEFNEVLTEIIGKEIKLEFEKKFVYQNLTILHTYHAGRINTNKKIFDPKRVIQLLEE